MKVVLSTYDPRLNARLLVEWQLSDLKETVKLLLYQEKRLVHAFVKIGQVKKTFYRFVLENHIVVDVDLRVIMLL